MHLGYHELRKMLEEFSKRKTTVSSTRTSTMPPPDAPAAARSSDRDYRPRTDEGYRDREQSRGSGYDRGHPSRNEYVFTREISETRTFLTLC